MQAVYRLSGGMSITEMTALSIWRCLGRDADFGRPNGPVRPGSIASWQLAGPGQKRRKKKHKTGSYVRANMPGFAAVQPAQANGGEYTLDLASVEDARYEVVRKKLLEPVNPPPRCAAFSGQVLGNSPVCRPIIQNGDEGICVDRSHSAQTERECIVCDSVSGSHCSLLMWRFRGCGAGRAYRPTSAQ